MTTLKTSADDHILPRPVEKLPSYAQAPARRAAASKLESVFGLDPAGAACIADAVVNPSEPPPGDRPGLATALAAELGDELP